MLLASYPGVFWIFELGCKLCLFTLMVQTIRGYPFNIYGITQKGDFIFGTQLGFANQAYHKITQMTELCHGMVFYEIRFPFNISAMAEVAISVLNKRY